MWDRIKAHLVEDWKQAYRWLSVQLAFLLVLLEGAYQYLPQVQSYFPAHWHAYIGGAILLARLINQTKRAKP